MIRITNMKNIILLTLVIAITAALVFAAFQLPVVQMGFDFNTVKITPNVGWNAAISPAAPASSVAFLISPTSPPQSLVGWNS